MYLPGRYSSLFLFSSSTPPSHRLRLSTKFVCHRAVEYITCSMRPDEILRVFFFVSSMAYFGEENSGIPSALKEGGSLPFLLIDG